MSIFTDRLSELIESKGITKKEFAEAIGVPPPQVTYYLGNREPSYDKLVEIANYFNVSTDYLTGRDDKKNSVDKTISEHLNELINQSEKAKEIFEKYPIDKILDEYFKNLLDVAFIQAYNISAEELFQCIISFNCVIGHFCKVGEKLKDGDYDVLDEIRAIRRHMIKIEILTENNSARIIKNIFEDDTVDQDIRNRIDIKTSYKIKEKTNKGVDNKFLAESSEIKTDDAL